MDSQCNLSRGLHTTAQIVCHAPALFAGFIVFLKRNIIGRLDGEKALQLRAANGYLSLVDSTHKIGDIDNVSAAQRKIHRDWALLLQGLLYSWSAKSSAG